MLTKETKAKAEEIKRAINPLIENAKKLAKKLQQAASNTRHAGDVARAWQYPDTTGWAKDAGEDSETIQRTRNENPHEWHEILNNKYVILHECYGSWSWAKERAYNYCRQLCADKNGYGFTIISYNIFMFTIGFKYLKDGKEYLHYESDRTTLDFCIE